MNLGSTLGSFEVHTTKGRGSSPDELADRALDKIMYVGGNAHPAIREQAQVFRGEIRSVLVYYMQEASRSSRVTMANKLREAGHSELIALLDD
jgi:TRAP-type uncharacterized transport system substrate-binding protein